MVWVIVLLTALNSYKGMYTDADGKTMTFNSKSACESMIVSQHLDKVNVLGTHGKCKVLGTFEPGRFQKKSS